MQPEAKSTEDQQKEEQRIKGFIEDLSLQFKLTSQEVAEAGFKSPEWTTYYWPPRDPSLFFSNLLRRVNSGKLTLTEEEEEILIEGAKRTFRSPEGDDLFEQTKKMAERTLLTDGGNNPAAVLWSKMTGDQGIVVGQFFGSNQELAALFEILVEKGYWSNARKWQLMSDRIIGTYGDTIPRSTLTSEAGNYRAGDLSSDFIQHLKSLPQGPGRPAKHRVAKRPRKKKE